MKDKFFVTHTRDMANPYVQALLKYGFREVKSYEKADFLLIDHNWCDGIHDSLGTMNRACEENKPVFMFPHGTRGFMFWDSVYEVNLCFTALFVPSPGHWQVLKSGGYPVPIYVTGWPWCRVKPFEPTIGRKILFAPIHPDTEGKYTHSQKWLEMNIEVWSRLAPHLEKYDVTVYHSWAPEVNGLTIERGVHYLESNLTIERAIQQIDRADVVIAQETFASLALARGKPTIMFDDRLYPPSREGWTSKYWPYYAEHWIYPLNFLAEDDIPGLIERATHVNQAVLSWKGEFIGDNFSTRQFVMKIAEHLY